MRRVQIPAAAVLLLALLPTTSMAQRESLAVDLPSGPAADGFDLERFTNFGNGWFETFYVEDADIEPLANVLADGRVAESTMVLVFDTDEGPLALVNDQMVYHHIAVGRAGDKDWMATF